MVPCDVDAAGCFVPARDHGADCDLGRPSPSMSAIAGAEQSKLAPLIRKAVGALGELAAGGAFEDRDLVTAARRPAGQGPTISARLSPSRSAAASCEKPWMPPTHRGLGRSLAANGDEPRGRCRTGGKDDLGSPSRSRSITTGVMTTSRAAGVMPGRPAAAVGQAVLKSVAEKPSPMHFASLLSP